MTAKKPCHRPGDSSTVLLPDEIATHATLAVCVRRAVDRAHAELAAFPGSSPKLAALLELARNLVNCGDLERAEIVHLLIDVADAHRARRLAEWLIIYGDLGRTAGL